VTPFAELVTAAIATFATKAQFCDAVGLQPYALARLVSGRVAASVEVCIRIAYGAHLDLSALLTAAGFSDIAHMLTELGAGRSPRPGVPKYITMHELAHLQFRRNVPPETRKVLDKLTSYAATHEVPKSRNPRNPRKKM
jgi:hypothetical protein